VVHLDYKHKLKGALTEFFGWTSNLVGLKPVGSEDGRHLTMSQFKIQGPRFKTFKIQGQDQCYP